MHKAIRMLVLFAIAIWIVQPIGASEPKVPLAETEITMERLQKIFETAYVNSEVDKDGDLRLEDGSFKTFIRIDTTKKALYYFALYGIKKSATETQKLTLANTLNDKLWLVRFSIPETKRLWCDYYLSYDGGISAYTIFNTYRNFVRAAKNGVANHDSDDIVGTD